MMKREYEFSTIKVGILVYGQAVKRRRWCISERILEGINRG